MNRLFNELDAPPAPVPATVDSSLAVLPSCLAVDPGAPSRCCRSRFNAQQRLAQRTSLADHM